MRIYGLTNDEVEALSRNADNVHFLQLKYDVSNLGQPISNLLVLGYVNWAFALGRLMGREDKAKVFIVRKEES